MTLSALQIAAFLVSLVGGAVLVTFLAVSGPPNAAWFFTSGFFVSNGVWLGFGWLAASGGAS